MSFVTIIMTVMSIFASAAIMIIATPILAAGIPFLVAAYYAIQTVYLRTSKQLRVMDLKAKAPLCTHFLESVAGVATILTFGWTNAYREWNAKLLKASQVPYYLLFSVQIWLTLVLDLIVAGMASGLVGIAVALKDNVDAGYMGLALLGVMDIGSNLSALILSATLMETSLGAIQRIREFVEQTPGEEQGQVQPELDGPFAGKIAFESLSAGYSQAGESILKGIDVIIPAAQKVALCGRTGSGKSSLVSALCGLMHIKEGQIRLMTPRRQKSIKIYCGRS